MPRKLPELIIEELPGDLHPSLDAAQQAALKNTASDLVTFVRSLLAQGVLLLRDGKVVPAKDCSLSNIKQVSDHANKGQLC